MNEIAPADKIQQLERRHVRLIDELDALNDRMEQALDSFVREKNDEARVTNDEKMTKSE